MGEPRALTVESHREALYVLREPPRFLSIAYKRAPAMDRYFFGWLFPTTPRPR